MYVENMVQETAVMKISLIQLNTITTDVTDLRPIESYCVRAFHFIEKLRHEYYADGYAG